MKPRYFPMLGTIFAFTAAGGLLLPSAAPALSTEVESNEDVEVLTRGPVHEAFAESVSYEPEAGLIVASAPPALIEELPPEQQPEGDNVTWIPGYWAWDDDQSDFLWVSGVWRNIPPGREWVPGYWDELDDARYQWVSGYWQDPQEEETTYIATAPPRTVDTGPNIDAPGDDHTWIPGNWRYQETRYVWSPGYWTPLRPNWTWVPSRYVWSPLGYVYVDGYWDYAVVNRGVLFAPVYYRRHVWETPGYYYTPSVVVSLDVFAAHLFIRPRCRHYYFGDYYAPRYRDAGFFAAFTWHRSHRGYDPIWAYQRWHHRHDRAWERRYEDNYNFFRENDRFRPPHTWAAMRALRNERFDDDRSRSRLFANNFDNYVQNPERGQRFKALNQERRQQFVAQRKEMREFARQRKETETKQIAAADGEGRKSVKEKLRRSPVVGRQAAQLAENERPPQRPEGRRGRGARNGAASGDETAPGDDGKLTQKEKMRRAAGGGANKGGDGATGPDTTGPGKKGDQTTDDGKLTQKEKLRRAAGGGAKKGGDGATGPDTTGPGKKGAADDQTTETDKPSQKEKIRRAAGGGGANKSGDTEKATPKREAKPTPKRDTQATPKREAKPTPKRDTQAAPKREAKPAPKREVQPAPQRKQQPEVRRQAPQRKEQAAPQRQQVQPKQQQAPRKQQQKPERKKEPQQKEQASRQAQRSPQIAAQRQPRPQARQAPERKQAARAQQQARQAAAQPRKQQAQRPQQQARRPQQQAARQQQAKRQAPQQREGRKKRDRDKAAE